MFTKKSTHRYRDSSQTFSYFIEKRRAFNRDELGAHAQEAEDNRKESKRRHKEDAGEVVAKVDAPPDASAEDSRKAAVEDDAAKKREALKAAKEREDLKEDISKATLDKIAAAIGESPEAIRDAMYNYNLTEHDEPNRISSPGKAIIDKIIQAKSEGKLEGVRFVYLGGTNGIRHDLNKLERRTTPDQKKWHEKKSAAFEAILAGKDRFKPATIQALISANEKLIVAYRDTVAANNPADLRTFLTNNESTFCDAAGLFDLALAYQRADDLYQAINGGEKIDPLKNIITLELATDPDEGNCKSKLLFEGVEGTEGKEEVPPTGRGEVDPIPGGRGELRPTPPRGPNDPPPPVPPPAPTPRGPNDIEPDQQEPGGAVIEGKLTPSNSVHAELRVSTFPSDAKVNTLSGRGKINAEKLKIAQEKLQNLDPDTKKRLHFLTPPIFGNEYYGMPQRFRKGNEEGIPEGYFVKIDINKTPSEIIKSLEKAAKQILDQPNINDMTDTERVAEERARKAGIPFKNIRQAYLEDSKSTPRINWNDTRAKPNPPYEWVEPSQEPWVNCATESPAEKAARAAKAEEAKNADADEARRAQERARLGREDAQKKAEAEAKAEDEAEKKRIAEEPAPQEKKDTLNTAVAALEAKIAEFKNPPRSLDLHAHDKFEDDKLKNATIDDEIAQINKLTEKLDKFGTIFDDMSDDTKNILKSVLLMIDQDKSGKPADDDISGKDGNYTLWFNILHPDAQLKKEILNRKNAYVKGGRNYIKDTPLEARDRAAAGATPFKNSREAYAEKGISLGKDANGKEMWNVAKDHEWAGSGPYNYATVETAAPTPPPTPETPPEGKHKIDPADSIKMNGNKITTKEKVDGEIKSVDYTIKSGEKVRAEKVIVIEDTTDKSGKYLCMPLWINSKHIGQLYLGYRNGTLSGIGKSESGFTIEIKGSEIIIEKEETI